MDANDAFCQPNGTKGEVDFLLETLRREGLRRRNLTRWIRLTIALLFALMLVACFVDRSNGKSFDFMNLILFSTLLGGSCAYGLTPGLRKAVHQAASLTDKRLLGPMIEALDSGDAKLKDTLESALVGLLEQVAPEDLGLLDDYQLERLTSALRLSANTRFCVVAIRAIGHIGNRRALQNLEVLTNDPSIPHRRLVKLEPFIRATMAELRIRLAQDQVSCVQSESKSGLPESFERDGVKIAPSEGLLFGRSPTA